MVNFHKLVIFIPLDQGCLMLYLLRTLWYASPKKEVMSMQIPLAGVLMFDILGMQSISVLKKRGTNGLIDEHPKG